MGRLNRRLVNGLVHHCYQKTIGGYLIFYSVSDFLVFFTTFCCCACNHHVQVLKLCLMYDHIHVSLKADKATTISSFVREYTSRFAKAYNAQWGLRGPIFCSPFGSAVKRDAKAVRTNFIYVDNNPVERHIVSAAEQYRWNFLAYYHNDYPFSTRPDLASSSWYLRDAFKTVISLSKAHIPLTYAMLAAFFSKLRDEERKQLVDKIISSYNVIQYDEVISFFGTYENMLLATHANTGSEYEIKETFAGKSDALYPSMTRILMNDLKLNDIHEIFHFSDDRKEDCLQRLFARTALSPLQIGKYLHLSLAVKCV